MKKAQSIAEYVLIMSVVLAAVIAVGFIAKSRNAFSVINSAINKTSGQR